MALPILSKNKQTFIRYNRFRKQIFSELSPRATETILYLLPWMLSVNHPACPGFVVNMVRPLKVFNIDNEWEIRRRESNFKRLFEIKTPASLLHHGPQFNVIQGLYTIGSVGTVSQTANSDCDIWVCCDKNHYDEPAWNQLHRKINLIKDWLDLHLKMQVYFFVCDENDIRENRFGNVDSESSGSTQKNILKEEFYRTCIVICGKIPLWWLCHDDNKKISYELSRKEMLARQYSDYDIIDLGDLQQIEGSEYFGAALWQLQKSLTRPLKSIIKMTLLKILLDSPEERPICHQFRKAVLRTDEKGLFPDPIVFTIHSILNYYQSIQKTDTLEFLKQCFYIRCEFTPHASRVPLKNELIKDLFQAYPLDIKKRIHLSRFDSWDFNAQLKLGNRLFQLLMDSYRDITAAYAGNATEIDKRDFTIVGRKILVHHQRKPNKIIVLQKPTGNLNLTHLTIRLEDTLWQVYSGSNKETPLAVDTDILNIIGFIVWNNLFDVNKIRMEPNSSNVTMQEIANLGKKLYEFIGTFETQDIELAGYIQKERLTKLMVVISFENFYWEKNINDFGVLYKNNWGELFLRRFISAIELEAFLKRARQPALGFETAYYLQRNSSYYEKIIERTKQVILSSIKNAGPPFVKQTGMSS
ncbi:MAG: class I adenylate cyclase [Desulfobacterales bacterium]|jgi:adenylate cyclase class 1|nr:class I adenylate cyclase [Desulfobacterales bacterium]